MAEHAKNTSLTAIDGQKVVVKAVSQMEKVGQVTSEVQAAVDELEQGSKKIGEITDVITGIAAQTNLLALNAAIETATEEQTAASEEIASASQNLAMMAQDLQVVVSKFSI